MFTRTLRSGWRLDYWPIYRTSFCLKKIMQSELFLTETFFYVITLPILQECISLEMCQTIWLRMTTYYESIIVISHVLLWWISDFIMLPKRYHRLNTKMSDPSGLQNPLWPIDAIQRHRSGSIMTQVKVPCHWPNECSVFTFDLLLYSPENILTVSVRNTIVNNEFKNYISQSHCHISVGQWVECTMYAYFEMLLHLGNKVI